MTARDDLRAAQAERFRSDNAHLIGAVVIGLDVTSVHGEPELSVIVLRLADGRTFEVSASANTDETADLSAWERK